MDREGVRTGELMNELDTWAQRFRADRISQVLGRLTPAEHLLALGCTV